VFVQGAPCVLREENINPARGLANGTEGVMHSICFSDDNTDHFQRLISEGMPGELIEIPVPYSINVKIRFKDNDERIMKWPEQLTLQSGEIIIPMLLKRDLKGID
jgi:hypothetical protein